MSGGKKREGVLETCLAKPQKLVDLIAYSQDSMPRKNSK